MSATDVPQQPTGPTKAVDDFMTTSHRRSGNPLAAAAQVARQYPQQWVFAGTSLAKLNELDWRFVKEVVDGDKATLGGKAERWNACAHRGVIRDGQPVIFFTAEQRPEPGETEVNLKWIAYLGPRANGA